jgi:hypothetical protein
VAGELLGGEKIAFVFHHEDISSISGASDVQVTVLIKIADHHDTSLINKEMRAHEGKSPVAMPAE